MWRSLLVAVDQSDRSSAVADIAAGLIKSTGADVRVFHVRECPRSLRVTPLEDPADAQLLVDETVLYLWSAGVVVRGRRADGREPRVATGIVEEAQRWRCDAIVLGSRRLRGCDRLLGRGVRESVIRTTSLPVIVSPPALRNTSAVLGGDVLG
jgi:nucleotide-binding universal stress UspA family protein